MGKDQKFTVAETKLMFKIKQIWSNRKGGNSTIVIKKNDEEITICDTTPKGRILLK